MKVIGTTRGGFILEAESGEVANLCGYYSHYPSVDGFKPPSIGDDILVSAMYQKLYQMAMDHKSIEKARRALLEAAATLEPVVPILYGGPHSGEVEAGG